MVTHIKNPILKVTLFITQRPPNSAHGGEKALFWGCMPLPETNLVWWFRFNTFEKYAFQSNWIISPGFGVNIPKIFELPPPIVTYLLLKNGWLEGPIRMPFKGALSL